MKGKDSEEHRPTVASPLRVYVYHPGFGCVFDCAVLDTSSRIRQRSDMNYAAPSDQIVPTLQLGAWNTSAGCYEFKSNIC